jgi:hypothetical protein
MPVRAWNAHDIVFTSAVAARVMPETGGREGHGTHLSE